MTKQTSKKCKWINDGRSEGSHDSWHCGTCGKCVFYETDEPTECVKDNDEFVLMPNFKTLEN